VVVKKANYPNIFYFILLAREKTGMQSSATYTGANTFKHSYTFIATLLNLIR